MCHRYFAVLFISISQFEKDFIIEFFECLSLNSISNGLSLFFFCPSLEIFFHFFLFTINPKFVIY